MSEHEPEWMRDKRLRDEEARMVQLESNVASIERTTTAIRELFEEERRARRAAEAALLNHEQEDATKFSSIDSRLQGIQTQLSSISDTQKRIEDKVAAGDGRIQALEDDKIGRTAVARWLRSAWVQMGIGASIGGTLVGVYALVA
jgi:predicted nuclease with TOPRIM domain